MNNDIEILKKFFSHSSESVFILDYDFNMLWCSSEVLLDLFSGTTARKIFENEQLPLESREYFFTYNGMEFPCRVINYTESRVYVIQMSGDDSMFASVRSEAVRHFFSNQTARVREAVTGITSAVKMLNRILDESSLEQVGDYMDIASGRCYDLLKSAADPAELIKYTEDMPEPVMLYLTDFIRNFTEICGGILGSKIRISSDSAPDLYIKTDPDRFTFCLLSLVVLAGKNICGSGEILLSADRIGEHISVTASSAETGKISGSRLFSRFEPLYRDEASDPNLFVVYRFCRTYNGTLFVADDPEGNGKIYSIRLPLAELTDDTPILSSPVRPYGKELFSVYHTVLSEIADIY